MNLHDWILKPFGDSPKNFQRFNMTHNTSGKTGKNLQKWVKDWKKLAECLTQLSINSILPQYGEWYFLFQHFFPIIIAFREQFALLLTHMAEKIVEFSQTYRVCLGLIMGRIDNIQHRTGTLISEMSHSFYVTVSEFIATGLMIGRA